MHSKARPLKTQVKGGTNPLAGFRNGKQNGTWPFHGRVADSAMKKLTRSLGFNTETLRKPSISLHRDSETCKRTRFGLLWGDFEDFECWVYHAPCAKHSSRANPEFHSKWLAISKGEYCTPCCWVPLKSHLQYGNSPIFLYTWNVWPPNWIITLITCPK